MKTCTKCQTHLDLSNFTKDKQKPDGLSHHCKACRKATAAARYQSNRDEMLAKNKKWAVNSPEKAKEAARRYRQENREAMLAYQREWREKNPGKARSICSRMALQGRF